MCEKTELLERRGRTHELIDKLLQERQELLVAFGYLAGVEPYDPHKSAKQLLQEFCQLLMDYIALMHFEVYARLEGGTERRAAVTETTSKTYPKILDITQMAVAFNDRYQILEGDHLPPAMTEDLNRLGEALETRFELEDQLFAALRSPR